MTAAPIILPEVPEPRLRSPVRAAVVRRWRGDGFFRLGAVLVLLTLLAALFAPWLAPHDPLRGDLARDYLAPPGGRFVFGADAQGRDVLSRVLYGARLSLLVGLVSQAVAVALGLTLGILAGYFRGAVDLLVMRLADITLAFPSLLLLIAFAAAIRPSLPLTFVVIGVVGWAGVARLVRAQVLLLARSEYVVASHALGGRARWVMLRHLVPNVRGAVIIIATLGFAGAIMAEAALSFLGLGAQPPTPSWGAMVAEGRDLIRVAPWVSVAPGLAVGAAVLGFNLLGDGLREALDPLAPQNLTR
jgi:ABC-type dipeptide/oligopeptide/nickel transport system permease subunit